MQLAMFSHVYVGGVTSGLCCISNLTSDVSAAEQVFDQYLAFAALESGLFSLAQPHSYLALNDPAAKVCLLSCLCALLHGARPSRHVTMPKHAQPTLPWGHVAELESVSLNCNSKPSNVAAGHRRGGGGVGGGRRPVCGAGHDGCRAHHPLPKGEST
jgi:hypothetical protein